MKTTNKDRVATYLKLHPFSSIKEIIAAHPNQITSASSVQYSLRCLMEEGHSFDVKTRTVERKHLEQRYAFSNLKLKPARYICVDERKASQMTSERQVHTFLKNVLAESLEEYLLFMFKHRHEYISHTYVAKSLGVNLATARRRYHTAIDFGAEIHARGTIDKRGVKLISLANPIESATRNKLTKEGSQTKTDKQLWGKVLSSF